MKNNHVTDLTHGSIPRHLIAFAVPLMLGNLFQLSYNMVDTIVIGRFAGSASLAAVGTCDQIMNLLILGVSGVCLGASVLMGNYFGAGDRDMLLEEMKTTVALALLFALLVLGLGIPLSGQFFRLMHVQPEALGDAAVYLRIIFLGMPFTCLYNIYAAALRSVGDPRTPVRYLILSCLINIALDLLLVAVFRKGVLGAALATLIAQGVSALLCILHVSRNTPELHFSWTALRLNPTLARKTLTYGGFTALQQCAQPIGNLIIQGTINTLGVSAAAAFSAARKIEDIGLLPGRSVSGTRAHRQPAAPAERALIASAASAAALSASAPFTSCARSPSKNLLTLSFTSKTVSRAACLMVVFARSANAFASASALAVAAAASSFALSTMALASSFALSTMA